MPENDKMSIDKFHKNVTELKAWRTYDASTIRKNMNKITKYLPEFYHINVATNTVIAKINSLAIPKEEKKAKQETKRHTNQPLDKNFHQLQKKD